MRITPEKLFSIIEEEIDNVLKEISMGDIDTLLDRTSGREVPLQQHDEMSEYNPADVLERAMEEDPDGTADLIVSLLGKEDIEALMNAMLENDPRFAELQGP